MVPAATDGSAKSVLAPNHPQAPVWRASDADREHVAQTVHEAVALGMLTMTEAEERLTAVYAARFRYELGPITADLPIGQPRSAGTRPAGLLARLLQALGHLLAVTAPLRAAARAVVSRHRVLAAVLVLLGVMLFAAALFVGAGDGSLPD